MKKFFTVIMIFSLLTSLFSSFTAKAQDAAAPAAEAPATETTTTTTTTVAAPVVDPSKPAEATPTVVTETTTTTNETKPAENSLENTLYMDLKDGRVVIQLMPEVAPNHVKRIKELVRQGFYDGVPFHRVIDGFMAQTGDPTGTGTGGSGQKIDAEFNAEKHVRGTVSMARAADPNSADSQFFIVYQDAPHLDGNYTVFGKVVEGMEFVDKIKKGSGPNGMVSEPDKVIKLKVAADEKAGAAAPATPAATETKPAEPAKQ